MYKLIASVATLTLAGSAVALAATSSGSTPAVKAAPLPAAQQGQPAYHQANTASPVVVKPKQKVEAANQTKQKAPQTPQTSVKTASAQTVNSATVAPNYGASTLMSRLNAVSAKIHLARKTGKLTGPQYMRLHSDYSLVASNIDRAHDRFGQEIPNRRLWGLNGQIRYLSNQASKLIG